MEVSRVTLDDFRSLPLNVFILRYAEGSQVVPRPPEEIISLYCLGSPHALKDQLTSMFLTDWAVNTLPWLLRNPASARPAATSLRDLRLPLVG